MSGWVKMPNYRLNLPDYSDRAIFEGLVNHLIHRDYTVMGGEVHIDIYDDRVELVSPGAMPDGTQIQDRDIYNVPSIRRNPVIADMFTQLDYMEKRGSGLRKMREQTEKLPNFLSGKEPLYKTEASSFFTTFYNLNWGENGRISVEEVAFPQSPVFDKHSKSLIVDNIKLMLDYCIRFYDRQFITRENLNSDILSRFETLLYDYFHSDRPAADGLPTVQYCADNLCLSANYLSDLLRKETGMSAMKHIQQKTLEMAKERVFNTQKSISEIAYELGFTYPQHFSRWFKKQAGCTPNEYRAQA